jgi:spore germination protein YaaH
MFLSFFISLSNEFARTSRHVFLLYDKKILIATFYDSTFCQENHNNNIEYMERFVGIMEHCNGIMHTVKPGDTLYSISIEHKVPLARLLQVNPYVDVYNLQVGETICVPVKTGFVGTTLPPSVEKPSESTGENTGETENDGEDTDKTTPSEEMMWEYTTRKGDTLEGVLGLESIPLMSGITIRLPKNQ